MRQPGGQEKAGIRHAGQGTGIALVVTKPVAHVWLHTAQHTQAEETLPTSPQGSDGFGNGHIL